MAGSSDGKPTGGEHSIPAEGPQTVRSSVVGKEGAQLGRQADQSRRRRRRQRDDLAERRAVQAILAVFLSFGGVSFLALNYGGWGGAGSSTGSGAGASTSRGSRAPSSAAGAMRASDSEGTTGVPRPGGASSAGVGLGRRASAQLEETPELPALRRLEQGGLTVGAEGLPKVESAVEGARIATLAGIETCRFAYGVWEFSPNETFRFLSTCRGLGRLELVGAYELRGTELRLSELAVGDTRWRSVFEVESPSTMRSEVRVGAATRLVVKQRVTVVRPGLHGDDFRTSFGRKNRLVLPARGETGKPSTKPKKSALETLLGG